MRLRVKPFATHREIVGVQELTWTTHAGTPLEAFFEEFLGDHPGMAP
jgi:molybdopterin converting factor small subunit